MTRVGKWVMIVVLGLLPVFFLPLTQDYYDTNKWALLVAATIFILILWGLRVGVTGTVTIAWNRTIKGLGVLTAAALVSLLLSPNKVEALLAPFGVGTLLSLFLIVLIGSTFFDEKARNILRWTLMTTVSLSGLLAIYQFFGLGKLIEINPGLMTILIVTLPLLIAEAFHRKRAGHDNHMIVAIVMTIASLGGLFFTVYQVLPKWGTTTLPFWVNWQILLESYKNWKQLLVGVGAENFLAAFTAGRPAGLNETALWNTRFTVGSSMLFHIATVYGLIGAAATGWFLWPLRRGLMLAALSLIFLPPSLPALAVITTLLIFSESTHPISLKGSHLSRLIAALVFLFAAASSYGLIRAYGAELAFGRSIRALEARNGTASYNFQIQAITQNPKVTRFHTSYSQTNLALASAISGTASASAEDRQTATQLIQQAIREAKLAVNMAPTNILAWENIASVYQTLTGVAQGADQWTVAAYARAMQLDPTNPVIRLRLGGAYVGQQKLDLAAESYTTAITLKPDYANAYYNLAFVYREQKKYALAALALKETLKYVTPGGDDRSRTQKELDELNELLTKEEKLSLP
ncbi:MAG: tetratricopeptide repeat protein [Patescibacteria group bacterium]